MLKKCLLKELHFQSPLRRQINCLLPLGLCRNLKKWNIGSQTGCQGAIKHPPCLNYSTKCANTTLFLSANLSGCKKQTSIFFPLGISHFVFAYLCSHCCIDPLNDKNLQQIFTDFLPSMTPFHID